MAVLDYSIIGNLYYNICEDNFNVDLSRLGDSLHATMVHLHISTLRSDPLVIGEENAEVGAAHMMYVLCHILEYIKNDIKHDKVKSDVFNKFIPDGLYTNFVKRCKILCKELYDNKVSPSDLVYRQVTDRNANDFIIPM